MESKADHALNDDRAVAIEEVSCAGGCGAGARGPLLAIALPEAGWVRVVGAWLCWLCASDPSVVSEVGGRAD